jgi:signal transduction histidine kinase
LSEVSQAFSEAGLDYDEVLKTIARLISGRIGDDCAILLFSEDGQKAYTVAFYHPDPRAMALMQEALQRWPGDTHSERFRTLLSGETLFLPVVDPEEFRAAFEPEFWPYIDQVGVASVLAVPLQVHGSVIGALVLTRDQPGRPYTFDVLLLMQSLAHRAALTIQNARLFASVSEQRERLRRLSARLVEVQEAERRDVARELHDEFGQILTGLQVRLQMSGRQALGEMRADLDQAQSLVVQLMDRIQDLTLDMRPTMLDDLGLVPALEAHIERYTQQTGIRVQFGERGAERRFPPQVETAAYRIVQEALTNVARHAAVQEVAVHVEADNDTLTVQIDDAGAGFDVPAVLAKPTTSGLSGMRERAELLGGELTIESAPGAGTQITAEFPLHD